MAQGFKKKTDPYHFEEERKDSVFRYNGKNLYEIALHCEDLRNFDFEDHTGEEKLDLLEKEIKVQVRITKQVIFILGELLTIAKKICQEKNKGFKQWINNKFDFSYETAINFMHVYRQCLGYRELAKDVPTSILYKVSSPSFPDELREYLLTSGALDKIGNKEIQKLSVRYKKEGIESVEKEIDALTRGNNVLRQVRYTFDICDNAVCILQDLELKIKSRGGESTFSTKHIEYEYLVEGQQPEAGSINLRLFNAIVNATSILSEAINTSRRELGEFEQKLNNAV